jgi:hypothetical protein
VKVIIAGSKKVEQNPLSFQENIKIDSKIFIFNKATYKLIKKLVVVPLNFAQLTLCYFSKFAQFFILTLGLVSAVLPQDEKLIKPLKILNVCLHL